MRIAPTDVAPALSGDTTITPTLAPGKLAPTDSTAGPFSALLGDAVRGASDRYALAAQKTEALATGQSDDIHGTMIAVKEAEISVKLVGSIRNKLLDAFHEIWRTSV